MMIDAAKGLRIATKNTKSAKRMICSCCLRGNNMEPTIQSKKRVAVVLLSGGLDSATLAAIARSEGYRLFALSVDYGQRHRFELEAARRVAESLGVERHVVASVGLDQFGGSALTADIAVPLDRNEDDMSRGIPITYVPARNTVFLSL